MLPPSRSAQGFEWLPAVTPPAETLAKSSRPIRCSWGLRARLAVSGAKPREAPFPGPTAVLPISRLLGERVQGRAVLPDACPVRAPVPRLMPTDWNPARR